MPNNQHPKPKRRIKYWIIAGIVSAVAGLVVVAFTEIGRAILQHYDADKLVTILAIVLLVLGIFTTFVGVIVWTARARQKASAEAAETLTAAITTAQREYREAATAASEAAGEALGAARFLSDMAIIIVNRAYGPKGSSEESIVRSLMSLSELTDFENGLPDKAFVYFHRPREIQNQALSDATKSMRKNSKRGIQYRCVGPIKSDWSDIATLEKHEVPGFEDEDSMILPSLGFVVYLIEESEFQNFSGSESEIWAEVQNERAKKHGARACGFLITPLACKGGNDWACAVQLSKSDVPRLIRSLWPES